MGVLSLVMDTDEVTDGRGRPISEAKKIKLFRLAEVLATEKCTKSQALERAGFDPRNLAIFKSAAYKHIERVVALSLRMDMAGHRRAVIGLTMEIAWDKENQSTKDRLKALELAGKWFHLEQPALPSPPSAPDDAPPGEEDLDALFARVVREVEEAEVVPD